MNSYILRRLVQTLPPWAVLLRRIRIVLLPPLLLLGMVQYAQSQSVTVERRVSAGNDDAEERSSGSMYRSSSDLELVDDGSRTDQTVGMRFNGIDIPQGATILNSYVQFQVDETNSGSVSLEIRGQNDDNATTFTSSDDNITSRPTTAASVSWAPVPWTSVGAAGLDQRTPNISTIIQEIVNRTGWAANNSLVIMITGSGERTAESYNGKSSAAPLLHVEYLLSAPPVLASIGPQTLLDGDSVNIGVSASDPDGDAIALSASDLPGFATFTDDGNGTGTLDLTPGSDVGVYSVTVTASDGALTDVENFDITVLSVSSPPVITEHPADQTVVEGRSATFSVAAVGSSLSSQWQADRVDIVGATDASYTTPLTTMADDGTRFRAVVTNTNGEVTSGEATLTVRPNVPIVVNAINRPWLYYENGDPFFMCGPGDPEDFLYRGARNPDGTRNGDQMELINKLAGTGANSIYFQTIRSHGGQGNPDHNPFINSDPSNGLDEDILAQWETWFTAMDEAGILIYLTFFDDGANVWGSGDGVPPGESLFLDAMVTRFDHHQLLTWVTAEEYQKAFSATRISDMAALIRASDEFNHPIAVHKLAGLSFSEFADDPNIDQFAIQYSGSASQLHDGMVQAFADAAGRYNLNMAEAASHGSGTEARLKNWAIAMGGAYVMVSGWDIAATSKQDLEDCGRLVRFMERTDFQELAPRDDLAHGGTEYVLAQPPDSYILYASSLSGEIGVSGIDAGPYSFRWFDASNGNTVEQSEVTVPAGNVTWPRPAGIGTELAVWIQLIPNQDPTASFTAAPTTGDGPLPVTFDATASDDPDGTIVSYNWDYGDQTADSGQTPSHTYSGPGSYAVILTVTDNRGGTATATTTVTVTGNYSPTASFTAAPTTGEAPLPVEFDATASYDPEDGTSVSYDWDYGDQTTGSGPTPSHTYTTPGTYSVTLTVTDTEGVTATATGTIIVGVVDPIDVRVSAGNDDAEERSDGSMYRSSSDLELVDDGSRRQTVGMRFNGIDIPQGATILNAYVQFQVDETNSGSVLVEIRGQDDDNATTFTSSDGNITSRPTTAASVSWAPPTWTSVGAAGPGQRTPDLKDIIQEIVNRTGWAANNSLVIIITGSGERTAESYNGKSSAAPLLHVEYVNSTAPANQPPVASFTANPPSGQAPLTVGFDAAASTDPDGTSLSYYWDYGDTTSGSGLTASHTYTIANTYTVMLTVTDIDGATDTATSTLTVSAPSVPPANQPPVASFTAAPTTGEAPLPVEFDATASYDPEDGTSVSYDWDYGDQTTGSGPTPSHTYTTPGTYSVTLTVTDTEGVTATATGTIIVGVVDPIDVRVSAGNDDAEERSDGSMYRSSSDLELVDDGSRRQTVGMRFNGIDIPQGATILNAYVQFQVDETNSGSVLVEIRGQDDDNATTFTSSDGNITSRPTTAASVSWAPPTWTSVGAAGPGQRTPDLKDIIQEIVNRTGWAANNSLVIIITGSGERTAESYNGKSSAAPLLHVEYVNSTAPANQPPVASFTANPPSGQAPLTVGFDAAASTDPDGTSLSYYWDYGDTTSGSGLTASHTYTIANTYTVMLTVTDIDGATDTATSTLTVSAPSVPPVDQPPTASLINPVDNSTVSGTVTIKVDANDGEDAAGSLTIEVRIDSVSWQTALYNGDSGYYELGWDNHPRSCRQPYNRRSRHRQCPQPKPTQHGDGQR